MKFRRAATPLACLALSIALTPTARAEVNSPPAGSVYREFRIHIAQSGNKWRVTDPNATFVGTPTNSPSTFLPNPTISFNIPSGALTGAISAVAIPDYWGGHVGTINQRLRFNGRPWRFVPGLTNTPTEAECYTQQWNPAIAIPPTDLRVGNNVLEGTSGGQTCFNFRWGQWGWYGVILRVFYNPASVPHVTGSISAPGANQTVGEDPIVRVSTTGAVSSVEVFAHYSGPDSDGDGDFLEYHQAYHRASSATTIVTSGHVGTDTTAPYDIRWDTELVPDQSSIRMLARIQGTNGVWYVTPEQTNIRLQRASGSVLHFKPSGVPRRFWVRNASAQRNLSSTFTIPSSVNLSSLGWAKLIVRTWNGIDGGAEAGQIHGTWINGHKYNGNYGANHHYQRDVLNIPVSWLINGTNTVRFDSTSAHHGIEILWPGPELVAGSTAASSNGVCGDSVVDVGEECDDGNTQNGDTCNSDCTLPGAGNGAVCGDGTVDAGEQCDDGNVADGDGCQADCSLPTAASSLPAMYPFEGSTSTVVDIANGNSGTLVSGAARTSAGRYGKSLVFNGISGNVNLGAINVGGPFTIAMWIKARDFGVTDARMISKASGTADEDHYFMLSTVSSGGERLRFRLKTTSGGTSTLIANAATLTAGSWVHAAAVWDGATMRLYQNALLVGSLAKAGTPVGSDTVEAWIGNQTGGGKNFDGEIDELIIDDRAYSAVELTTLMSSGLVVGGPNCGNGVLDPGEACDDGGNADGDGCSADCSSADPVEPTAGNSIRNGDFSAGTTDWLMFSNAGGSFSTPGGEALVRTVAIGDNVQLYQKDLSVTGGAEYTFRFRARANRTRQIQVQFRKHTSPFDSYGLIQLFTLDTTMREFQTTFTVPGGDKADGRLMFWLARDIRLNEDVWIDDVVMGLPNLCGNSSLDAQEECDDGNLDVGDGCDDRCRTEACGNARLDFGEACDDGNLSNGDGCDDLCHVESCGNGTVDAGEVCDDGNTVSGDGCSADCSAVDGGDPGGDPSGVNAIRNPQFTAGTTEWSFYSNAGGSFTTPGAEAVVQIAGVGNNVQLYQANVAVTGGSEYVLRFRARASRARLIQVHFRQHTSPYTPYGLTQTFQLSTVMQDLQIAFTVPGADKSDGRLMFWFANDLQAGDRVVLDDIALATGAFCGDGQVDAGEVCDDGNTVNDDSCSNSCTPGATTADNLVTNGDFSGGSSFWAFYTNGVGNFGIDAGAARVTTTTTATNLQLYQRGIKLKGNTAYRMTFRVRNSVGADLLASVLMHQAPHTNLGLKNVLVNVGVDWQTKILEFTTAPGDQADARLMFWFANHAVVGGQYFIDDVMLVESP